MDTKLPVVIYCLRDPRDNSAKYVGQTVREGNRELQHKNNQWQHNTDKFRWGNELKSLGLSPVFEILERCDYSEANQKEMEWVEHLTQQGAKLFNWPVGRITRDSLVSADDLFPFLERLTVIRDELVHMTTAVRNTGRAALQEVRNIETAVKKIDRARWAIESRIESKRPRDE